LTLVQAGASGGTVQVTAASGGVPTAISAQNDGQLYTVASALPTTGGTGTGLTVNITSITGTISTVAGMSPASSSTPIAGYSGDGGAATLATINEPDGVAVDGSDNLYILDSLNSVVREVSLTTTPTVAFPDTPTGSTSNPVTKVLDNLGNAALNITGLSVPTQFVQQSTVASGALNCGTTASSTVTASLAAGEQCSILVAFAPTLVQSNSASLVLTDNAGNAAGSTQPIALTGKGVSTGDTVTVAVPPVTYPSASMATITVTTSGTLPSTTVSYSVDGGAAQIATLVGGTVTVNLGSLAEGTHSIAVTYTGSSTYATTTATTTFTVLGYAVAMSVTLNPTAPTYGTPVIVTVTLTSSTGTSPTGTVSYRLDNGLIRYFPEATNDSASFSLGTLALGTHSLVVCYLGNTQDESLCQTLTVVVGGAPTTTTVTSSATTPYIGEAITLTATVTDTLGIPPPGTVTFMNGSTALCTATLSNGTASVTIFGYGSSSPGCPANLLVGTYPITAVFTSGNPDFASSTSAVFNQVIAPADFTFEPVTTPTVTQPVSTPISSISVTAGQPASLNVWVIGNNEYPISSTLFNPLYAYAGTLTLSCSGLPDFMGCSFTPSTETFTNTIGVPNSYCTTAAASSCVVVGTTTFPYPYTSMTIATLGHYSTASLRNNSKNGIVAAGFLLPGVLLAGLIGMLRRRMAPDLRRRLMAVAVALAIGSITGLSGCSYTIQGAAPGTYQINIVGTDSTHNIVRSTPLTVVVTQ